MVLLLRDMEPSLSWCRLFRNWNLTHLSECQCKTPFWNKHIVLFMHTYTTALTTVAAHGWDYPHSRLDRWSESTKRSEHIPPPCVMSIFLLILIFLPSIFCWCCVRNSRAARARKGATVANEVLFRNSNKLFVVGFITGAHLPHHFTGGFLSWGTPALPCWRSFLVFDATSRFFCPQSQKQFSHLFLSHFASRARVSTGTIWVRMLTCAPTRVWNLHKCTNPGRMVKLSQCPGCPDKQCRGGGEPCSVCR